MSRVRPLLFPGRPNFGTFPAARWRRVPMSSEADSIRFFQRKSVALALAMPVGEARDFLRGLLLTAGDSQLLEVIRAAYIQLCEADQRLDSLAKRPAAEEEEEP